MASKFQEAQRAKQRELIKKSTIFHGVQGGGYFRGVRDEILKESNANLFCEILDSSKKYINDNKIVWWGGKQAPTAHTLSSQIACLNHLFLIRNDKESVLKVLNNIRDEFVDVLPISCDKEPAYISFEVTSRIDRLNESKSKDAEITRGSNCTSIDAFIYAEHKSGELWLIPIEWKYTEHYNNQDKSLEDRESEPKGSNGKGQERLSRYCHLIDISKQLKKLVDYRSSIYFYEPFYQLMRQTLWAEQVILNKDDEMLKATNYLHLHIIPNENHDLLDKRYKATGKGMEQSWRECLNDQSKYKIVDPRKFLAPIANTYPKLFQYLEERYW